MKKVCAIAMTVVFLMTLSLGLMSVEASQDNDATSETVLFSLYNGETISGDGGVSDWWSNMKQDPNVATDTTSHLSASTQLGVATIHHDAQNHGVVFKKTFNAIDSAVDGQNINNLYLDVEVYISGAALVAMTDATLVPNPAKRLSFVLKNSDSARTLDNPNSISFTLDCALVGETYTPNIVEGWNTFHLPLSSFVAKDSTGAVTTASIDNLKQCRWFYVQVGNAPGGARFDDAYNITADLKSANITSESSGSLPTTVESDCIEFHVNATSGVESTAYYRIGDLQGYTIQAGDYFEYDVKLLSNVAGIGGIDSNVVFRSDSDSQQLNKLISSYDAEFKGMGVDYTADAYNTWKTVKVPLNITGAVLDTMYLSAKIAADANVTEAVALYKSVYLRHSNGSVAKVIFGSYSDRMVETQNLIHCEKGDCQAIFVKVVPTLPNTQVTVGLQNLDNNSKTITYAVTDDADKGISSLTGYVVKYTPRKDYAGYDSVLYSTSYDYTGIPWASETPFKNTAKVRLLFSVGDATENYYNAAALPEPEPITLVTVKDSVTNISIDNVKKNYQLSVTKLTKGYDYKTTVSMLGAGGSSLTALYNIELYDTLGVKSTETGSYTIHMPVTGYTNSAELKVYKIDTEEGKCEKLSATLSDGCLVFTVDSVSLFALASGGTTESTESTESTVSTTLTSTSTPATGESNQIVVMACMLMLAAITTVVMANKKAHAKVRGK